MLHFDTIFAFIKWFKFAQQLFYTFVKSFIILLGFLLGIDWTIYDLLDQAIV